MVKPDFSQKAHDKKMIETTEYTVCEMNKKPN